MPEFLADDWVAALAASGATLPERPGATATVSTVVLGGPLGKKAETAYRLDVVDGRVVAATPGPSDEGSVDLVVNQPWDDAVADLRGELPLDEAFMRGRTKVVGSTGVLMGLLPMLRSDEWRDRAGRPGGRHHLVTVTPDALAGLLAAALPGEALSAEELAATLFDDPDGAVLGDDAGAVGVAVRDGIGFVTVVVVDPAVQRGGRGRALLDEAHAWLRARGVAEVRTGAAAPRYLWPGVDVEAHAPAVALFRGAGYEEVTTTTNHACPVGFRADPPVGVAVRRIVAGSPDVDAVRAFATASYPWWLDEVDRAVPHGCCHGAFGDDGAAVGFACHSVNRAGWIGPMATEPARQGGGVGSALLGAVCRDLDLAEFTEAEIAWVGPAAFYEKAAGSSVSRRFVVLRTYLDAKRTGNDSSPRSTIESR